MVFHVTVTNNLKKVNDAISKAEKQKLFEAGSVVRTKTLEVLSGQRSGREYRKPGTKKTYIASAPGEPPAVRFGRLRTSVLMKLIKRFGSHASYVGIPNRTKSGEKLAYGVMLEFGTYNMAPRPWLSVAFKQSRHEVKKILSSRWF
jgi:hypothetical protein